MLRAVTTVVLAVTACVALVSAFAAYHNEQARLRNQPLAVFSSAEMDIEIDNSLHVSAKGGDLVLKRSGGQKEQVLFANYRQHIHSLSVYHKDLDRDGEAELIVLAEDEGAGDIYIFSHLQRQEITRSANPDLVWTANRLMFSDTGEMFIRSCGSQYCEDSFYLWRGGQLVEGGINSFESW